MQIWVDADACPNPVKDILFRAAERLQILTTLVANQTLRVPPSPYVRSVQVPAGFDRADAKIAESVSSGDLVITADIPLAAAVITRGALVLNPHGELYTPANIGEALGLRNFMDGLRSSGVETGGPAPFSNGDRQRFAKQLEKLLPRQP